MRNKIIKGIKVGLTIVAGIGVEIICGGIARMATSEETNPVTKACASIAGGCIGALVTKSVSDYISDTVDDMAQFTDDISDALNNSVKEEP